MLLSLIQRGTNILDDIRDAGLIESSVNCILCELPPLQPLDFKFVTVGSINFLHGRCHHLLLQNKL